jgi:two-component system cell cycle sensor histidine kinase/response regulator CckA
MSLLARRRKPHETPSAAKAAVAYLLLAVLWVYGTDEIVSRISMDARTFTLLENVKGILFVAATALSLYFLLRRHERLTRLASEHRLESGRMLRLVEERFEAVFRHWPIPAYLWQRRGDDFILVDLNDAARETGQSSAATSLGATAATLYRDDPELVGNILECFERKASIQHDQMSRDAVTGAIAYLSVTYVFVSPDLVLVHAQDMTSIRAAAAALRQSEEKSRVLVEQAADGIAVLDADGKVEQINERALQLLRVTEQQARNLRYEDFVPAEDQVVDPTLMSTLQHGQELRRDRRLRLPDGSELLAEISARRLPDGRFLAIFRDVTERRNAEELLRVSEERFRNVVEQAPDIIFEVAADGTILSLNPAFEAMTGWSSDEWIGRDFMSLIAPESKAHAEEVFKRRLMADQDVAARQEYALSTRSGKRLLVEVNSAVNVVEGKPRRVFGFGRDVTRERERDLERSRMQARLEQSDRVNGLGRVAATIAHEINNVLMGISPFVEVLLKRPENSASVSAAAAHIAQSVQRGKRVTQDILRFTRAAEPIVRVVDLFHLLEQLVASMRPALGSHLKVEVDGREPSRALVDGGQMEQVFANLLINARDASSTSGSVEIVIDGATRELMVELGMPSHDVATFIHVGVSDQGSGIASDVVGRIFEPLFTTKRGGTGLGLSIVRQIVTAHGGYIGVTSRLGFGTSFHVFLPRATVVEDVAPDGLSDTPMRIPPETRLLMVEDDSMVAEGLLGALAESMIVEVASTGASAIMALRTFHPQIVLLDVSLPDMTGFEVFEQLASEFPNLPVIFSTGHADESEVDRVKAAHPVRYLLKPYDTDTLVDVIAELLALPA